MQWRRHRVDMSTPLLLEVAPEIVTNPSFTGERGREGGSDPRYRLALAMSVHPTYSDQEGYIFYAGGSLAGAGYYRQCRRRLAILPLQLWQGCQDCVKISTQRLPRVAQFNAC